MKSQNSQQMANNPHFDSLVEYISDSVMVVDLEGRVVDVNPAFEKLYGWRKKEVLGRHLPTVPDELTGKFNILLERVKKGQKLVNYEIIAKRRDGLETFVSINLVPLWDKEGNVGAISTISRDIMQQRTLQERESLTLEVLRVLNQRSQKQDLIRETLLLIKKFSGCDAVGIRLREGEDFLYYVTKGFPLEHIQAENRLCAFDEKGGLLKDTKGNPLLECVCGCVIRGFFDSHKPFFTSHGSFWTNSTSKLLTATTEEDLGVVNLRGRCLHEGYESIALIPLKSGDETVGLLQLNDRRKGRFTLDLISYYEQLSESIGIGISSKQAEEVLRESEECFRSVAETASDAIASINIHGNIIFWNHTAETMFGYSADEVVGKPLTLIMPERFRKAYKKAMKRMVSTGEPNIIGKTVEVVGLRKDGSEFPMEYSYGTWRTREGIFFTAIARDITERKQAEELIREQNERLRELDRMKSEFISTAAHELRTPLTSILGFSEILLKRKLDKERQNRFLKIINEEAAGLTDLINDLLDVSRIESGRGFKIKKAPFELRNTILENVDLFKSQTDKHDFEVNIPGDLASIEADEDKIDQVMENLISNAIKFSLQGGKITVSVEQAEGEVKVSVADTGMGIPQKYLPRVFERFYRVENASTHGMGGAGLGLAIAKYIVESHGGKIWAESEVGKKGSTFSFTLPIKATRKKREA